MGEAERVAQEQFVQLTTTRRSGVPVPTPVWVVALGGDRLGVLTSGTSGKVKRLAHTPAVTLRPCDRRGRVADDAPTWHGTARVVRSGPALEEVVGRVRRSYGLPGLLVGLLQPLRRHPAAVVVTLDA